MPSYIGNGVIEGFPEVNQPVGLRHVIDSGLIAGLWLWSSGGGWAVRLVAFFFLCGTVGRFAVFPLRLLLFPRVTHRVTVSRNQLFPQGPHVEKHYIWPMLNTLVLLKWFKMTEAAQRSGMARSAPSEAAAFQAACQQHFASSATADCDAFYTASVLSQVSILQMRYCKAYDTSLNNTYMPTNNWMRDDRLGGLVQLQNLSYGTGPVFTCVERS